MNVMTDVEAALRACKQTYDREIAAAADRRDEVLRRGRDAGLSDYKIGQITGYSREYVGTILGPKPSVDDT